MKRIFYVVCLWMLLMACKNETTSPSPAAGWKNLGLDGAVVNGLDLSGDTLYAATDRGFFLRNRKAAGTTWKLLGFEGKNIQSFVVFSEKEMLVSLFSRQEPLETALYKTTDGGENWRKLPQEFGGTDPEPVFDITRHPQKASTLYAAGYSVVAQSDDGGESWKPIYGDWGALSTGMGFVRLNPIRATSIWAGGQNGIEQGILWHSRDGGSHWENWLNLLPPPSVAKSIAFHPTRAEEVYVGFEGGVLKTANDGKDWETVLASDEHKFFFGLAVHPNNPQLIYSAGWLKRFDEPQPFVIYVSRDGGKSWETHRHAEPAFGGVYDLKLIPEAGRDKLYVGLYKGGVYEVTF